MRTKRYFFANTYWGEDNFEYHAKPLSILLARVVLVVVIVGGGYWAGEDIFRGAVHSTLLLLLLPWAVVRGMAFNARYSSYRGVRFSFRKTYTRMYALHLPAIMATLMPSYYFFIYGDNTAGEMSKEINKIIFFLFAPWLLVMILLPTVVRAFHRVKAESHAIGQLSFGFMPRHFSSYMGAIWGVPLIVLIVLLSIAFLKYWLMTNFTENSLDSLSPIYDSFISIPLLAALFFIAYSVSIAALFRLFWKGIVFSNGQLRCSFSLFTYTFKIVLTNLLAIIFSFGLLYPWAKIRKARYLLSHMAVVAPVSMADVITTEQTGKESALGAEIDAAEGFGFDGGIV